MGSGPSLFRIGSGPFNLSSPLGNIKNMLATETVLPPDLCKKHVQFIIYWDLPRLIRFSLLKVNETTPHL